MKNETAVVNEASLQPWHSKTYVTTSLYTMLGSASLHQCEQYQYWSQVLSEVQYNSARFYHGHIRNICKEFYKLSLPASKSCAQRHDTTVVCYTVKVR